MTGCLELGVIGPTASDTGVELDLARLALPKDRWPRFGVPVLAPPFPVGLAPAPNSGGRQAIVNRTLGHNGSGGVWYCLSHLTGPICWVMPPAAANGAGASCPLDYHRGWTKGGTSETTVQTATGRSVRSVNCRRATTAVWVATRYALFTLAGATAGLAAVLLWDSWQQQHP